MTSIDLSDAFLHILIHCLASTYVSIGKYDPIVLDPATHTRVISQPLRSLAMDKSVLETNRMESIRRRFVENGYSDSAVDDLSSPYLDAPTIAPCISVLSTISFSGPDNIQLTYNNNNNNEEINRFPTADLINFPSDLQAAKL